MFFKPTSQICRWQDIPYFVNTVVTENCFLTIQYRPCEWSTIFSLSFTSLGQYVQELDGNTRVDLFGLRQHIPPGGGR